MKKLNVLALAIVCAFAVVFGVVTFKTNTAQAAVIEGSAPTLGKSFFKISTDGDACMIATAIQDFEFVYAVGYDFEEENVEPIAKATGEYYSAISMGDKRWTPSLIFKGEQDDDYDAATGMIVWELPYGDSTTYHFTAYALWGRKDDETGDIAYDGNKASASTYKLSENYVLSFENGEEDLSGETKNVTIGEAIGELPEITAKAGYTVDGWKIADTLIDKNTVWRYRGDKTATAVYTANTYTLTCGETELPVTYGKAIGELPAIPDKAGYTATGWAIGETAITAETVWTYTGNKTATATYTANLVEVNTWATFWSAVQASETAEEANSYIVLTADLDPKTELGRSEYKNHVMSDFYGVIDGQGHVIKNVTIYQDTAANAQQMSVFDTFTGELKNIGFVNMQYAQQNYGNCNGFIARSFTGFADNIYLNGNVGKNIPNGYGGQWEGNYRFGAMFGNLQSDSTVKNCIINLTEANANVYDYGYVAGNVFGSVTVENIATTDNAHGQMFGNFRGATVNGTSCTNNETALDLIDHFTSDEDDLLFNASSVLDGGADAIAYAMILTHKNVMRVTTAAELYTAANDNSSAYIVLANDIDCQDYTWAMINNTFTGTLNGGGHSIQNVTLTGGTAGGHTRMGMFKTFNGKLKNVAFDNAKMNVKGCLIAGLIASTFGGTATNVKVDVEFLTLDAYQDTNHRAGAMFGETGSTATVSNCFIKVVTPEVNKIGYIAGRLSTSITMDNIVVVTNAKAALFLMTVNSAAKVNGTVITNGSANDTSDGVGTNAISAMDGHYLLIDTEANVIANAGSYLGSAWVCDGEQLPYLKTIDEE